MKAIVLAAGRGERLRPLTDHTPKPLLNAAGKPLIEHLIGNLVKEGITEIVINLAHLGEQIRQYLGSGQRLGACITYSDEGQSALETGGGIFHALPYLGTEPFLAINGDVATDFPFGSIACPPQGLAHLVLIDNPDHNLRGDFGLDNGHVTNGSDRPFTFAGIGVYRPELFKDCQPGKFPLAPLLRAAIQNEQVTGERYDGFWMDIGTEARLGELNALLNRSAA